MECSRGGQNLPPLQQHQQMKNKDKKIQFVVKPLLHLFTFKCLALQTEMVLK